MSGGRRIVNGSFVSDGNARTIHTVGFRPERVDIKASAGQEASWFKSGGGEGMPDASMHRRTAAGVGTFAVVNGITPVGDGFTLGADAQINVNGVTLYWSAFD